MDAIKMIEERRSVRKYKDETVDRETMKEIIEITRWAPSWANYQIARYTLVDDRQTIARLATDGVKGFTYNPNSGVSPNKRGTFAGVIGRRPVPCSNSDSDSWVLD